MRLNDYLIFEDENNILFRNVGKKRTQQRSLATQKTRTLITPLWKPQNFFKMLATIKKAMRHNILAASNL